MQLLNQSRQLLAVSIVLYSLYYILRKQYIKYFILIFLASLIHFTSIVALVFPLLNIKKDYFYPLKNLFFFVILIISFIAIGPIMKWIIDLLPIKYITYVEYIEFGGLGYGLVLNLAPIILPIIVFHKYNKQLSSIFLSRVALLAIPFRLGGYSSYYI